MFVRRCIVFVFLCVYVLGSRYFQCFMVGLLSHHLCIDSQVVSECLLLGLIRGLKRSVNQGTKRVHPLACRRSKHLPWAHQTMKAWFSPAQSLFFILNTSNGFGGPWYNLTKKPSTDSMRGLGRPFCIPGWVQRSELGLSQTHRSGFVVRVRPRWS